MSGITNPSERYFKDGLWTFDGSVWRPQNQLLAYRDVVRAQYYNPSASAGANVNNFAAIATGYVHVIEVMAGVNFSTAAGTVRWEIVSGGVAYLIGLSDYKTPTRELSYIGSFVLNSGENIRVTFNLCVLADVLYAAIAGHKFLIAE